MFKGPNTVHNGINEKVIPKNIANCENLKDQLRTLSNFSSSNKKEIAALMDEIDDFIMYLQGKREITHKLMKEKQN